MEQESLSSESMRYWQPPLINANVHNNDSNQQSSQPQEDETTRKIRKFAIGLAVVFLIFAIVWWIWAGLCAGSSDEQDSDDQNGSFCEIMNAGAQLMNDFTAGVTFMVSNIIILIALGVVYLVISIVCNISSKCPEGLEAAKDWLTERWNEQTTSPQEQSQNDENEQNEQDKQNEQEDPDENPVDGPVEGPV